MLRGNTFQILTKFSLWGPFSLLLIAVGMPTQALAWYGVHLESYRTQERAALGWEQLKRAHSDIASDAPHRILRVESQDNGAFFRVVAGPFASFEDAMVFNDRLVAAGRFARVVAIDDTSAPLVPDAPKAVLAASPAKPIVDPAPKQDAAKLNKGPALKQEASANVPSSTQSPTPSTEAKKPQNAPQKQTAAVKPETVAPSKTGAPLKSEDKPARTAAVKPGAAEKTAAKTNAKPVVKPEAKQEKKTQTAKAAISTSKTDETTEAQNEDASSANQNPKRHRQQPGAQVAKPKDPVTPLIGNLPSEFGQKPRVAPSATTQEIKTFLPYVGLGFSF